MAAAYAALVSVLNDLEDIQNHPIHSFSFDDNQIQSLSESVTFLIEFMESYDNCYGPSKEAAQLLENDITTAAQAAEQVIESHVVNQINGGSRKKRSPKICGGFNICGMKRWCLFLRDLEKVIEDMGCVRSKAINVQQARSGLELKQPTNSAAASSSSTQPDLTSEKTTMVGFDELLLQLLDLLTGYPYSRRVIPIIGAGGIGKTTLARNAFDHELIVQHFDICLWATISQQYVVQDILSTLLSCQPKSNNSETFGDLGEQLHKRLCGRRYLVVLDDIWSVRVWDEMKSFFPDTNNGSRILVTTRLSDLAYHIGSVSPLAVSLLDDDKSWDLFCQKAFAAGEGCPLELEDVGKSIVSKCKGLPLAIVVVAGHLRRCSRTQEYWVNVANNIKSVLNSEENEQFFDILSFSYVHLPVHIKPCFIYMGTFQEDERIDVEDLINCWIAEGFLKPCKADNLEDIAKGYLKDLIDRNLIILDGTGEKGTEHCKIHDVLRELCLKVAKKEKFFYVDDTAERAICRERRAKIFDAPISSTVPLVRSLEEGRRGGKQPFDLRLCRVLRKFEVDEGFLDAACFMKAITQHVNLRYLYYYQGFLTHQDPHIPSSISLFWNLQTLIITGVNSSVIAPNEIWEMIQLRHLEVVQGRIHLPDPLPRDKLEEANELVMRNLHTLLGVDHLKLSEEVCKRVPNIKELRVSYFSSESPHNLGCFRKLESLELNRLPRYSDCREFGLSLTFPSSLKKLSLRNTDLDWEEMTMMVGSLPHLQILTLLRNAVTGSEWTLVGGEFLHLKSLTIRDCNDLIKWNADSSHFPVLENLYLDAMRRLEELPSDIGTIPTLRCITLRECSVSLAISAVRILVEQEDQGNEDLRLHVDFTLYQVERLNKMMEDEGLTANNLHLSSYLLNLR